VWVVKGAGGISSSLAARVKKGVLDGQRQLSDGIYRLTPHNHNCDNRDSGDAGDQIPRVVINRLAGSAFLPAGSRPVAAAVSVDPNGLVYMIKTLRYCPPASTERRCEMLRKWFSEDEWNTFIQFLIYCGAGLPMLSVFIVLIMIAAKLLGLEN
jgi:hypothetical protein